MTRRLALIAAGTALASAATLGAASAHADEAVTEPVVATSADYLACAGLDTIDVALCLERPSTRQLPPPRQVLYDLTGVPVR